VLCMSNSKSNEGYSGSSVYSCIQADPKISVKNGSKFMVQYIAWEGGMHERYKG
jgi:hypothetical protein